jgi:hypothetical protein
MLFSTNVSGAFMTRKPTEPASPAESARTKVDYGVSAERFVEVWQTSNSAQEVADRTGMPLPIVHARASGYRKQGVKLKKMPRAHGRQLDIEALNRLIEEIERGKGKGEHGDGGEKHPQKGSKPKGHTR